MEKEKNKSINFYRLSKKISEIILNKYPNLKHNDMNIIFNFFELENLDDIKLLLDKKSGKEALEFYYLLFQKLSKKIKKSKNIKIIKKKIYKYKKKNYNFEKNITNKDIIILNESDDYTEDQEKIDKNNKSTNKNNNFQHNSSDGKPINIFEYMSLNSIKFQNDENNEYLNFNTKQEKNVISLLNDSE